MAATGDAKVVSRLRTKVEGQARLTTGVVEGWMEGRLWGWEREKQGGGLKRAEGGGAGLEGEEELVE